MRNEVTYLRIADMILDELSKGVIPWARPWVSSAGCYSRFSYSKKENTVREYSWLNSILLGKPGEYGTFNQWKSIGGHIKKGSHAKVVFFAAPAERMCVKETETGESEISFKKFHFLKSYLVFHIDDVEGVEPLPYTLKNMERFSHTEPEYPARVLSEYLSMEGITLERNEGKAFYSATRDVIAMPEMNQFPDIERYYEVFFHEVIHSTISNNRLGVSLRSKFGDKYIEAEEVIAELGSLFLCAKTGINIDKIIGNVGTYIDSWSKRIGSAKSVIGRSINIAGHACDFVLGKWKPYEETKSDPEVSDIDETVAINA